ncbi:MAG: DUF2924 domain-containing protein [Alphaproteobacteria bacterium]|nr:DUF2924 domain-containing protein [Alphaproteobacteria bacterium]
MAKIELPTTLDALRAMPFADRATLWAKYSPHPFKRQMRALWYYIQCDRFKLRIEPKFLTKIKKYKDNPTECVTHAYHNRYYIRPGTVITRTFRRIMHEVIVNDDNTFTYNGEKYRTLSAIAKDISGIKISGPDFFGLSKNYKPILINKNNMHSRAEKKYTSAQFAK